MSKAGKPAARMGDLVGHSPADFSRLGPAAPAALTAGAAMGAAAAAMPGTTFKPGPPPKVPSGMIAVGSPNVFINFRPAARATLSLAPCVVEFGVPIPVKKGAKTVKINGRPAARIGDSLMCKAAVLSGSSDVKIGDKTPKVRGPKAGRKPRSASDLVKEAEERGKPRKEQLQQIHDARVARQLEIYGLVSTYHGPRRDKWDQTEFVTKGVTCDAVRKEAPDVFESMQSMYDSKEDAEDYLPSILESGSSIPEKLNVSKGDVFYKIVAMGGNINGYSVYYLDEDQVSKVKDNPHGFEAMLGLPVSSQSVEYDIFEIEARVDTVAFQSKIAPTHQSRKDIGKKYSQKAGGTQTLILNNANSNVWEKSPVPSFRISTIKVI